MSIVITDLCKSFGSTPVLQRFTWTVERPMVLMGRSGCGKTTLLRILLGLESADSGTVTGVETPAAVFQEDRLCPQLTAAAKDGTLRTAPGQTVQVLCRLENGGFGTGHNTVLSLLHSRVHFILNPDIQLTADTLSDLADWMAAHPGVVMTRPGLTFPDGRPQQLPLRRCNVRAMAYRQLPCLRFWAKYNDRYLMADKDLTKPTEIEFCTGSFSAVDTAAFKAVGGFDEGYFMYVEDADLTQKMRTRGKVYLVPQYTAIHAWHRAAHRSLKPFLWQLRSLLRYFSKWGFAW